MGETNKEDYHAFRRKVTEDLKRMFEEAAKAMDAKLQQIEQERLEDQKKAGVGVPV